MKAIETTVDRPMEQVESDVRRLLAEEGFGVLTEIDVAATLRAKIGVDRPPLRILGACNPTLAHRALEHDPSLSLLLPCNVVLEQVEGGTRVAAVDPVELLGGASQRSGDSAGADELAVLAEDAGARLRRVVERLGPQ